MLDLFNTACDWIGPEWVGSIIGIVIVVPYAAWLFSPTTKQRG